MDNIGILNYVRQNANSAYSERIPKATQTNLSDIANTILTHKETKEEFTGVLLNKIVKTVVSNKLYSNPLKFLKKSPIPFGKTIENVFVDLIKSKNFDEHFGEGNNEASSLISKEKPNVKTEYYSVNYKNKYKISVSDEQLKEAFMDMQGLHTLTQSLIRSAISSAEYDEYLITRQLINKVSMKDVEIQGFDSLTEQQQAKKLTKVVKTMIEKFRFMSSDYNAQGVNTHCLPSEVVIFVTPETSANIDVELLASQFNLSKTELPSRLVTIDRFEKEGLENVDGTEVKKMVEDEDTLAVVCDYDTIQLRNSLDTWETFRNSDQLTTNMFHHVWGSACGCGFTNAIRIKKTV